MKTVLVVEDNRDNFDLVAEILEDEGYVVTGADSAEEGIRIIKKGGVDLVLMDVGLPDMDGLEATKIIKSGRNTKNIPIVALTAYAMKGDREKTISAGCDEYLPKPLNEDKLIETIKTFIGEAK